jgi:hypothetical protein
MFTRSLALLFALLTLGLCAAEEKKDTADPKLIARLIEELGDRRYAKREAAERALRQIGVPALDALREAARNKDAEVRRRATRLLRQIETLAEAARLLASPHLRLVYKDTPLADAVADIEKKTGIAIKLEGDTDRLPRRKVTLDTGNTTFWEAMDQFCAKSGLVEVPPPPPERSPSTVTGSIIVIRGGGGGMRLTPRDILTPGTNALPPALILRDGKPTTLPKYYAGTVRLRALPPDTKLPDQERKQGEVLLVLEGKAGPTLLWNRPVGLRIEKAVDDQGQQLQQVAGTHLVEGPQAPARGGTRVVINQVPINPRRNEPENQPHVPVRLTAGKKPSKALKELSGTLIAQVQTTPESLVVVDNILKSAGRVVKGPRGGSLKVGAVVRQEGGEVKVRVLVEPPTTETDDGTAPPLGGMTVIIDGQEVGPRTVSLSASNFALLDEKGKPLQVVKAVTTGVRAGPAQEVELIYRPAEGQPGPARFVYTARRGALLEVPFTLRNIPLP